MDPQDILNLGQKYSKKDLSILLKETNLSSVREGVFSCKNSNSYLLFVDLEKTDKETRFHFDDFFEEDYFHWDSQTTQNFDSPKIQDIVSGKLTTFLLVRVKQKERSKTLPFTYCGKLIYQSHEKDTSNPVHIIFQNTDFDDFTDNQDLLEIYQWKPSKIGKSTKSKIVKSGQISDNRKGNFKKPDKTERRGLVTSRVGQGYYRQQIVNKWEGKCPVSGINIPSILISSHIVSWSESTDEERLDVENGILLSPLYDSLFDRHFISFNDDGTLLISGKFSSEQLSKLNLPKDIKINVSEGMKKYLKLHREKFNLKEDQ